MFEIILKDKNNEIFSLILDYKNLNYFILNNSRQKAFEENVSSNSILDDIYKTYRQENKILREIAR